MNQRGFTILELIVGLLILVVVIGLVTETLLETRSAADRGETMADATRDITQTVRWFSEWTACMSRKGARTLTGDRMIFSITGPRGTVDVTLAPNGSESAWELTMNNRRIYRFPGRISFRYLVEETWRDGVPPDRLPRAVAIRLIHAGDNGVPPWEMIVNTPQAILAAGASVLPAETGIPAEEGPIPAEESAPFSTAATDTGASAALFREMSQ